MRLLERYEALNERQQCIVGFISVFLLLFLTNPLNLVFGYIEAEDGSTYLLYARNATLLRAVFAPHQGYYGLVPNLAMLLPARVLPLVTAAWVGVWVAFFFRLSTVWFVYTCESIRTPRTRLILALLLSILAPTSTFPGCLNTEYFLAVIASILLISDPTRHRLSRLLILAIGGLTSPTSCILLPFFIWRAWRRKDGPSVAQAAILSACTAIQLPLVYASSPYSARAAVHLVAPWIYVDTVVNHVLILPFLTRVPYRLLARYLETHPGLPWILFAVVGALALYAFLRILWPAGAAVRRILAIGFWSVLVAVVTTGTATLVGNVERYFIGAISCVAIALLLAMEQYRASARPMALRATTVLIVLMGVSGILDVVRFFRLQQQPLHWAQQVADWKSNPKHVFRTGPWFWNVPFYLPERPLSLQLPFYIYDTTTPESVRRQLPPAWFGPMDESTRPTSLTYPIDTSQK